MPAPKTPTPTGFPPSYRRLQKQLGQTGWVAMGSLVERGKPGQGGPRYQWTRRVEGKTLTVALSKEQFEWLKAAVINYREIQQTLEEMQQASVQHMWKTLPGTARRKPLHAKGLDLN